MTVDLHEMIALRNVVRLPTPRADRNVPGDKARVVGGDDLAHGFAGHHLTDLDGDGVGLLLPQSAAHIRIDREPDRSGNDLARPGRRDGAFLHFKVGRTGLTTRATLQDHRAADGGVANGARTHHAASAFSTRRPVTLPSRNRISASFAWLCGTISTGNACSDPSWARLISSRSSFGFPTYVPCTVRARIAMMGSGSVNSPPNSPTWMSLPPLRSAPNAKRAVWVPFTRSITASTGLPAASRMRFATSGPAPSTTL